MMMLRIGMGYVIKVPRKTKRVGKLLRENRCQAFKVGNTVIIE